MNRYVIFGKKCAPNRSIWRVYFQIFFTSKGAHPPQTPPFEGSIHVAGKIQNYSKKGNDQEVHLFSFKKKNNKSTKSLYLKHLFKNFFIIK